ncbi:MULTISPECIES: magnesium-translocating P-type ATPase [Streptacidiphilus]|uniref:Magnesium-transporting ATPase, P-type 1 n=1 Tax=Streptacidiphilus cavernicola TaxID=3342716 RepID=A0ABV6V0P5_9ACTN|nr:magnesium-translocating P-type ATPase [Streptacidiphilus jeojiense]
MAGLSEASEAARDRGQPRHPDHGDHAEQDVVCIPPAVAADLTELQVLRRLRSGPRGLLEDQAHHRLMACGENVLATVEPPSWSRRLGRALRDPFTLVLCFLAVISAANGARQGTAVIAVLVAVSCALRMAGESRADQDAAALRDIACGTATVVRRTVDGSAPTAREVPLGELVPGDLVRLTAGDLVPADLRLLRSVGLTVDQAPLTGESAPVPKQAGSDPQSRGDRRPALLDQPQLCFLGSRVAAGTATAVVVATGRGTHLATAHRHLERGRRATAFDRTTRSVARLLIRFMLASLTLVLAAGTLLGGRGWELVPFAIAVAVGLTPEMLPVVVTTVLARGVAELRRRRVVVKRQRSLYDLGAMDVLCVDKTGTLTGDRLTVHSTLDPQGRSDPRVLRWAATNSLVCLQLGDPPVLDSLDQALLEAADQLEPFPATATAGLQVIPFDPVRRLATAVVRGSGRPGGHTLVVKGGVEDVLDRCTRLTVSDGGNGDSNDTLPLDADQRTRIHRLVRRQAADGQRLLAVAVAHGPARGLRYTERDEHDLTLVGLVGFRDEPEPSAGDAVAALRANGVTVKVITGDHPETAVRACTDVGIRPGRPVLAPDLDRLDDAALARLAATTTLFARATPAHKARIVRALRSTGRTVGFLGDGANDIAALRAADLGICPHTAVDAAREHADILLTGSDLAAVSRSLPTARRSLAGIGNYLRTTLSANVGNVITMLAAGAFLPFLPMLPAQVLVQNLCFDAAQLSLAFDRPLTTGAHRPGPLDARGLARYALCFGLVNAAADLATFAVLGHLAHGLSAPRTQVLFHTGWFTENLITQAVTIHILRSPGGRPRLPAPWPVRAGNGALVAVGLLLPLTPPGRSLGMGALPLAYYPLLTAILGGYVLALFAARAIRRRRGGAVRRRPQITQR